MIKRVDSASSVYGRDTEGLGHRSAAALNRIPEAQQAEWANVKDMMKARAATDHAAKQLKRREERHNAAVDRLEKKRQTAATLAEMPREKLVDALYQAKKTRWESEAIDKHAPITSLLIWISMQPLWMVTLPVSALAMLSYCFMDNRLEKRLKKAILHPEKARAKQERLSAEISEMQRSFSRKSVGLVAQGASALIQAH